MHIVDLEAGQRGATFPAGVHERIAPLVSHLVDRLEETAEELCVPGHCWGYAARKIRGSSSRWSNHAWGLAFDFNAPAHPLGARGTFGRRARAVSDLATGLGFRWGGDYNGRADEMHFEFMGTPDDADRLVKELSSEVKDGVTMTRRTPEEIAATIASWPDDSWMARLWDEMVEEGIVNRHTDPIDMAEMLQVLAIADRVSDRLEERIDRLETRIDELEGTGAPGGQDAGPG